MDKQAAIDHVDPEAVLMKKKSYKRPSLQVFGEVGVLTRGSIGTLGDQGTASGKRARN